jgi:hypothetical protein
MESILSLQELAWLMTSILNEQMFPSEKPGWSVQPHFVGGGLLEGIDTTLILFFNSENRCRNNTLF